MDFKNQNECLKEIAKLRELRTALRQRERGLNARLQSAATNQMPQLSGGTVQKFEAALQQFLPSSHMPGNVGPKNAVVWPFWYQMNFDFGTNPTVSVNNSLTSSFQVSQEAAFMVMSIVRDSDDQSLAGALGPWQVVLRDAQSSRQLNDRPIPWQALGVRSNPSILPTPYFLFPNARFEGVMNGFNTTPFVAEGEAQFQLSFFGYRMRVEDAQNILSTVYGF